MSVEAIGFLPPVGATEALAPTQLGAGTAVEGPGFGQLFATGLESINKQLVSSQTELQSLAAGDAQNLHQVMIRLEETRLSFQLAVQVRNRLLEAYQDVMRMQV